MARARQKSRRKLVVELDAGQHNLDEHSARDVRRDKSLQSIQNRLLRKAGGPDPEIAPRSRFRFREMLKSIEELPSAIALPRRRRVAASGASSQVGVDGEPGPGGHPGCCLSCGAVWRGAAKSFATQAIMPCAPDIGMASRSLACSQDVAKKPPCRVRTNPNSQVRNADNNPVLILPPHPPPLLGTNAVLVPAPKLRQMLGISSVTMWRWRNNPDMGFPRPVSINDRNYFHLLDVQAWIERQRVGGVSAPDKSAYRKRKA